MSLPSPAWPQPDEPPPCGTATGLPPASSDSDSGCALEEYLEPPADPAPPKVGSAWPSRGSLCSRSAPKGRNHFNPLDHPPVCVPVPCPQVPACFESRSLDPASPADRSRLRVKALLQQLPPQDCDVRTRFICCCPPRGFISSLSLTSFTPCRSGTAPASPRRRGSSSEPSAPAADGRRWGRGRNVPCRVPATAVPARR